MPVSKTYLTTAEAAEVLRITPEQLRAARSSGKLFGRDAPEFYRVGQRKVLYAMDDLKAFVESAPKLRVTNAPEPDGLREAREG